MEKSCRPTFAFQPTLCSFAYAVVAIVTTIAGCSPNATDPAANVASGEDTPNQVGAVSPAAAKENSRAALGLHTINTSLEFRPQPKEIVAGQNSIWGLKVIDLKTTKGVSDFQLAHDKLMHLIIVSKDLSWFTHIHPEYKGYGNFVIGTTIPRAGTYKLYADYTPVKGVQEVAQKEFSVVAATGGSAPLASANSASLTADKIVGGWITKTIRSHPEGEPDATGGTDYQVALMPMPVPFKAGEAAMLHFQIRDEKGSPLTDLQPYLGAMGHAVLLSQDTYIYLHTHPVDAAHSGTDHAMGDMKMGDMKMDDSGTASGGEEATHEHEAPTSGGPDVIFHTIFPAPGLYKIWGQFQREDQIITAPFVVNVGGTAQTTASGANKAGTGAPIAVKAAAYVCPMHPEVTGNKVGAKCPKCGMTLEKRRL